MCGCVVEQLRQGTAERVPHHDMASPENEGSEMHDAAETTLSVEDAGGAVPHAIQTRNHHSRRWRA